VDGGCRTTPIVPAATEARHNPPARREPSAARRAGARRRPRARRAAPRRVPLRRRPSPGRWSAVAPPGAAAGCPGSPAPPPRPGLARRRRVV